MVVAQIPLWIIHGTTPSGVDNLMMMSKNNNTGTGKGTDIDENNTGSNDNNTNRNDDTDALLQNGKKQLNMWNNSTTSNSNTNDNDISNNTVNNKKSISERRSAIYCCDISNPSSLSSESLPSHDSDNTKIMGRIATGGGDGKIRIWNLVSLFQTSKSEPSSTSASSTTHNDNTNNDHDNHHHHHQNGDHTKTKLMGSFKSRGGYESSDSSEQDEDWNHSIRSIPKNNGNEEGENLDVAHSQKDHNTEHDNENNNSERLSSFEQIKDVSSLIKRKNELDDETSNGKKRKRIDLMQVQTQTQTQRPVPQASTTITSFAQNSTSHTALLSSSQKQPPPPPPQQQRLLCTIASHSGSVLTLRFSSSGLFLASAGDDAHVLIYTQTNTPSLLSTGNLLTNNTSSNGSNETKNVEHWERIRILRGHNLDVVGLAWAPDDSHLISCSLDSDAPICVWRLNLDGSTTSSSSSSNFYGHNGYHNNSYDKEQRRSIQQRNNRISTNSNSSTLHPYKILGLKEHTSTVKGVAFDPAGKYFASSGDDPAICVWRAFDDWGLEAKIDSSSGVFRSKKKQSSSDGGIGGDYSGVIGAGGSEEDIQALANLSLFRRISFAPDGSHICGTNATLRGKNIAAMISRNGWGVSSPKKGQSSTTTSGAANLVGHKQPVVSSRHCPYFFEVDQKKKDDEDEDEDVEPIYSTLVALGDKKGFVTIWSTKKSRPIFKLQCSESRCTVTDIAWGYVSSSKGESVVMIVSLLDGFIVALKFDLPLELGNVLSETKRHKIFRLKYGIELGKVGSGRRLVDDKSGPKLIENVLQFALEDEDDDDEIEENETSSNNMDIDETCLNHSMTDQMESSKQVETFSKSGKKRIQPVLLNQPRSSPVRKNENKNMLGEASSKSQCKEKHNSVSAALQLAGKAASVAEGISSKISKQGNNADQVIVNNETVYRSTVSQPTVHHMIPSFDQSPMQMLVPPPTKQDTFTVELKSSRKPTSSFDEQFKTASERVSVIAACLNSTHSPPGIGRNVACATVSITHNGSRTWKDHILGTHCTAISASSSLLAVGTLDGTIYLYGTSPTSGWDSGIGFRSHTPFVMNSSIVHLVLQEKQNNYHSSSVPQVEMLVLTADGSFGVYSIMPSQKLVYKGNIRAPITQMWLSTSQLPSNKASLPEVARIFITESQHLLLVLCHPNPNGVYVGGAIQGFVYNRDMEVWARISDERFLHSNFYTTVPDSKLARGLLSRVDEAVKNNRAGYQSQRKGFMKTSASSMFYLLDDDENCLQSYMTRAHCEDRLACALALKSPNDFKHWLCLYIRQLCVEADSNQLRFLIDLLLNDVSSNETSGANIIENQTCWWLLPGSSVLGIDKRLIVEKVIIPEMSKNRSLQRLLNELSTELNSV